MSAQKKISVIGDIVKEKNYAKIDINKINDAKEREIHILGYNANNKGPIIGARHVQVGLIFMGMTLAFAMRTNLSVAIVAMTDPTVSPNRNIPTYTWDNRSVILSSFYWGYICLQVLAGYLGKTYGPKYFLFSSFCVISVVFILIPTGAEQLGSIGVMICSVVQGLAQGFIYPSTHTIIGRWVPVEERLTMGIIVYSGVSCGSILSSTVTGYVSSLWIGWPASFYIFGALGLAWCVLYLVFGQNNPSTHPSISIEERRYIEASLGHSQVDEDIPVPWIKIFTCVPFWTIVVANIGASWAYMMFMTQTPTYLSKVQKFDMKSNGLVTAVPYMVGAVTGLIFAPLADYFVRKRYLSPVNVRKVFQVFGSYGLVICLLVLSYTSTTKVTAVLLLAFGNAAYSLSLLGYSVNHVDLSPRFSGILQGISNGTSQAIAICSPLLVQFVVKDEEDAKQWRTVFIVAALFYFICATFYAFFASATRQVWDGPATDLVKRMERSKRQSVISITG